MTTSRFLSWLYLTATIAVIAWEASSVPWKAECVIDRHNLSMHLSPHPVWAPPRSPAYSEFQAAFHSLIEMPPNSTSISVRVLWGAAAIEVVLMFWVVSILVALVSFMENPRRIEFPVVFARSFALCLTFAAGSCFVLYVIVGGWGPPFPEFFAVCGLVAGAFFGFQKLLNRNARA
ncbi:MAG: hypothetical protein JSS27_10240 [Planctomycetes bacterium]|nr:hypothetical protein [Planctomycetota bacterium]